MYDSRRVREQAGAPCLHDAFTAHDGKGNFAELVNFYSRHQIEEMSRARGFRETIGGEYRMQVEAEGRGRQDLSKGRLPV